MVCGSLFKSVVLRSLMVIYSADNRLEISETVVPNAQFEPMRTAETELGLDMKWFDNRVMSICGLSENYKRSIVTSPDLRCFRVYDTFINSESPKPGIELMLNLVPLSQTLQWD